MLAQNHHQLQGCPGAVAVLHTHARALSFHPYVHLALPAAALDAERRLWRRRRQTEGDLFSHKALARMFRGVLLAALQAQGLTLPAACPERWVVALQAPGPRRGGHHLPGPLPVPGRGPGARHPAHNRQVGLHVRASPAAQRAARIIGIGERGASALAADVGDFRQFKGGHQLGAWLGLVPSQNSWNSFASPPRSARWCD